MIQGLRSLWRRLPIGTSSRGVLKAALVIGILSALVKVSAVVKESVVAASFGTSDAYDAFVVASLAPTMVVSLISNSLNAALIPTYIRVRDGEGQPSADQLYSSVLTLNLTLLTALSLLIAGTTRFWLPLLASGFSPEKLALATQLVYWSMPLVVASGLATTWGSVLNAQERFGLVALAPAFQPLAILVALALLSRIWGVGALITGTLVGGALEAGIIGFNLMSRGHSVWPRWFGLTDHVRKVAGQYGATIGGAFLITSMGLVDQGMASMLGPGSNSALSYGMKIPMAFSGLAMTALGTAVLPRFSRFASGENWPEFRTTLKRYVLVVGALSIVMAIVLAKASVVMTQVLYQRGRFSAQDTQIVSQVQMWYLLRLPIPITGTLLVRALNALRANQVLATIAVLQALLNAGLDWLLMRHMGAPGIAAASFAVSVVAFMCISTAIWWLLNRRCRDVATMDDRP
ncbi:MAG TPA: lipid II flippase MurJ [Holophagaceae bacterium]|nr:lipid II flippase MurJ [Holophagaceae bacterium]